MNKQFLSGLVAGVCVAGIVAVNASSTTSTIESCAQLLPEGHRYSVTIEGTIDTSEKQREFKGSFGLSDDSEIDYTPEQKAPIEPFVTCVSALLK